MEKRFNVPWVKRQTVIPLLVALTCLAQAACTIENRNYEITVINPDPEAARVFLSGPDVEEEVLGVWSKAFFRRTRLSLRTELLPGPRTVFLGWKRDNPLSGPDGTFASADYSAEDVMVVDVNAYSYAVSPRVVGTANDDPRWIAPDRILFCSNRDGGDGIWAISPSGGPATRLTVPELSSDGAPTNDHRLDRNVIRGAWRGSPLVHVSRGRLQGQNYKSEVQTIFDVDAGACWPITASMFGVKNIDSGYKRYLSGEGNLVWFSTFSSDEDDYALIGVFRPAAGPVFLDALRSEGYQGATAGTGRYAFILSKATVHGSFLATRLWILDSLAGLLAEAAELRGSQGLLKIIYHQPVALSEDGASLLLSLDVADPEGKPLGANLAIVGSGGSVAFLPSREGFLEAAGSSFRFSADGSSLVGHSLAGAWGRYSLSDGALLEVLPEMPDDLSPSWAACVERVEHGDRYAADGIEPGGTRSVESAKAGRNTDLLLHAPGNPDSWLTGPGSGDDL